MALDICCQYERRVAITGRPSGASGEQFAQYLMDTLKDQDLEMRWNAYQGTK
jgi:isocitrate dehydrogenase (NAD+)